MAKSNNIIKALQEKVRESFDNSAKDIKCELEAKGFLGYSVFYIEWKSRKLPADERLCYALVDSSGEIQLLDDGVELVKSLLSQTEPMKENLKLLVSQLIKDCNSARTQTAVAFGLASVFMTIGLGVLVFAIISFVVEGVSTMDVLNVIASVLSEFIAGSALLLFRNGSRRLNEASSRLVKLLQQLGLRQAQI